MKKDRHVDDPSLIPDSQLLENKAAPVKTFAPHSETRNVFWGDLHIHTSLSFDAYAMGTRTLPDDAYHYEAPLSTVQATPYAPSGHWILAPSPIMPNTWGYPATWPATKLKKVIWPRSWPLATRCVSAGTCLTQ